MPKKYGNQKPRIDIFNDGDPELALLTLDLMAKYGDKPMPWQKSVLMRWMATTENGQWANPECGLSVPRQNGKTWLFRARIIGGMVLLGEALVYTAQSVKTVDEIKRLTQQFFYQGRPEIRNLLTDEFDSEPKSLDYIELRNGGRCVFTTRTRTSGLGFTSDSLLMDEDQEQTDAQEEALRPTISHGNSQNPQIIRAGTPQTSGSSGTVFPRLRNNVVNGLAPDVCWQEWSVETITDKNDRNAWYMTNPALGYGLMPKAIEGEMASMSLDSFNKMRLGWWRGVDSQRAISDETWNKLAVDKVDLPENPSLVYAVKFAPDRSAVSLAVGVRMPGNKTHVEMIERKPMSYGLSWLVKWLNDRKAKTQKIIIDGAAGSTLLVEELIRTDPKLKRKILTPNVREAGAAFGSFFDAVNRGEVTHFNQPTLNMSVRVAKKRDIGRDGMFGFATMNPDIQSDPIEAVALAYYGANRFIRRENAGTGQKILLV